MWRRGASGERRSTTVERKSLPDSINHCRRRYLTSVKCYPKRTQLHTRAQCTYVKAEGVFSIVGHVLFLFEALILVFFCFCARSLCVHSQQPWMSTSSTLSCAICEIFLHGTLISAGENLSYFQEQQQNSRNCYSIREVFQRHAIQ